ncbi:MAG: hypothetical protein KKF89_05575 [Nanoarchaeota archaeon]|nr:hypothetical protein [Nanoarchaeota archaeon]
MKPFKKYRESKDVRKTTPNPNEIKSIISDSTKRFETFFNLKHNSEMTKYVFENLYESLRELSECIALTKGLKIYSHEITISFLLSQNILDESKAQIFNDFRKLRNQSKYYGKNISPEKLEESIKDIIKIKDILIKYLEENGQP